MTKLYTNCTITLPDGSKLDSKFDWKITKRRCNSCGRWIKGLEDCSKKCTLGFTVFYKPNGGV